MSGKTYSTLDIVNSADSEIPDYYVNSDDSSCKSTWCQWKRIALICLIAAVVALALGLGLGLGLSSGSDDTDESSSSGCYKYEHDNYQARESIKEGRWEGECPVPGEPQCPAGREPTLLLVSMDGFRADYFDRGLTPVLEQLADCGVHAQAMRGVFPTKTFVNHYTIVTGLFPESHGIIANDMYDPEFKEMFSKDATTNGHWWGGEPLWNTVVKAGKNAATFFWPGSDSEIQGMHPTTCVQYDKTVPFEARVDEVLDWLSPEDPADIPDFVTLYFEEPDSAGHEEGPFGDEVTEKLHVMDEIMTRLMDGLVDIDMDKCINLIVLADHGMNGVQCSSIVRLDEHLDVENYYIYEGASGRLTSQYVEEDGEIVEQDDGATPDETMEKLKCEHYNNTKDWYIQFFRKEHLPKRYHYAYNDRIEEIVMDVERDWQVFRGWANWCEGGDHGYDNTFTSMLATFTGYGPAFKQGELVDVFDNFELYNLMTELVAVDPVPNNGTEGRLNMLLHRPTRSAVAPPALAEYVECVYPLDESVRDVRRNATDCDNCNLQDVEDVDSQLNLTSAEVEESVARHLPLGLPDLHRDDITVCQLAHTDYISAFSHQHHMPLWAGFVMSANQPLSVSSLDNADQCVRADVRLEPDISPQCSDMVDDNLDITYTFLYPPGFSDDPDIQLDAHITSNIVPMFRGFRDGIWLEALRFLEEYSTKYGKIHVTMGPLFDYNYDGHYDKLEDVNIYVKNGEIPVPTHYFMMASRCMTGADTEDCVEDSTVFTLVIPHTPLIDNCRDRNPFEYLKHNMVRVHDLELLAGLHLLTDVPPDTRVLMQTDTPVGLWPRDSWMEAMGDQCPPTVNTCPPHYDADHPPLLLISLDGFPPDYLDLGHSPTLQKLYDCGSHSAHMRSIYPTLTFPNHYTIVTGLYPESHGIIDNSMYDTNFSEYFSLSSDGKMNNHWWGGEPLWNKVEKEGGHSMLLMWPGSDVDIEDMRPTEWTLYDTNYPYSLRVETVLGWLDNSTGVLPNFMTLYFSRVDEAGHDGGPGSLWAQDAVEVVDGYLTDLMDGLYRLGLHQCVNIIITSDHGMTEIDCERSVQIADYLDDDTSDKTYLYPGGAGRISNQYTGASSDITPVEEDQQVPVEDIVGALECQNVNMSVYDKVDLPKRLHYAFNDRIDDIPTILADHWQVADEEAWCPIKGQHGWDPSFRSMEAFFLSYGPGFKNEFETLPFENIELYNVMAHLLGVTPAPNNGTEGTLYDILREDRPLPGILGNTTYRDCPYPGHDEYEQRANLTGTGCQCDIPEDRNMTDYDLQLDLEEADKVQAVQEHLPFGVPNYLDHTLCVLHQLDYLIGYSHDLHMPLWVAFTVTDDQVPDSPIVPNCLRPDVRVERDVQPICSDYHQLPDDMADMQLFPPELSSDEDSTLDALLLTNTVPMYTGFSQAGEGSEAEGVWYGLNEYIRELAVRYEAVHVIMGPVFDYNADGKRDHTLTSYFRESNIPIPSHYYAIVLRCDEADCTTNLAYEAMSFVLPHKDKMTNCMRTETYLAQNLVRIRDIELLTDLIFLTNDVTQDSIYTRTHQPSELWPVTD